MAYEPLHHKYRPQTFAELVGQEAIATTLSNALRQQRIAPAYLFTGARGTGKTSSARIFAKSLNCLSAQSPTDQPCGICEVCRRIANGTALDVIEIDAASNTGVDNIRELIERSQFAPVQCRYKVYVIDECHMLSTAAFNALLKTLEEPPQQVVFVLATTDPQRVLPTIISRCQRFDFRRIELPAMVQHLEAIAHQEAIPIAPEAVQLIAQISQGGLRDAESLLDQLSLLEGEIAPQQVWDLVGAVPERDLLEVVRAIAQDSPETLLDRVRHLMDRGREPMIVLQNLGSFYRDLLIAKTAPQRRDLVTITADTWTELCAFVQGFELSWILEGQRHLRTAEVQIRNTTQPRLWLEVTLIGLLPSALASSAPAIEGRVVSRPAPMPPTAHPAPSEPAPSEPTPLAAPRPAAPVHPAAPPPLALPAAPAPPIAAEPPPPPAEPAPAPAHPAAPDPEPAAAAAELHQIWQEVLSLVQPSTQALLRQQCRLLAFDGTTARIGIKTKQLLNLAKTKVATIEAAFSQYRGSAVRVSLEVLPTGEEVATPAAAPAPPIPPGLVTPPVPKSAIAPSPVAPAAPVPAAAPASVPPPSSPAPFSPPARTAAPAPAPLPPLPEVPPPAPWEEEDEVLRAARSFAQMFNGQIIKLEDGTEMPGPGADALTAAERVAEGEDSDEDDVPF